MRIRNLIQKRIGSFESNLDEVVVLEAALLLNTDWVGLTDEIWVTIASEKNIYDRLENRMNIDKKSIRARISSQMPQRDQIPHADVIITNDGNLTALYKQVESIWINRISSVWGNQYNK